MKEGERPFQRPRDGVRRLWPTTLGPRCYLTRCRQRLPKHDPAGRNHSDAIGSRRTLFVIRIGLCFNHAQLILLAVILPSEKADKIHWLQSSVPKRKGRDRESGRSDDLVWHQTTPPSRRHWLHINMVGALQE
jgi:hypothetical protein